MLRTSGRPGSILICILLVLGGLALPVRDVGAAGDVVVSVCDEASLRHAISTAEDGSTITFSCSGTITLTSAGGGVIIVEKNLTIDGSGQAVTISGAGSVSPFEVGFVGDLTLRHLTIINAGGGGDNLTNDGTLTVIDSTISGGATGIANWLGTTTVISSTISGNNTGIQAHGGTVNVTNSTITNNHSSSEGAGGIQIHTLAVVSVTYSTIVNNSSSCPNSGGCGGQMFVGGIYNYVGTLTLQDTIFSDNLSYSGIFSAGTPGNCLLGISFEFNDGGGNLSDDTTCGFNGTTSLNSVSTLNLGPLAYNGGPTQTILLGTGSAAIDFASCDSLITTDQRGLPRPGSGAQGCDSGAYEVQAQDTVPATATELAAISGSGSYGGTATLSAALTDDGAGVGGQRIDFTLNEEAVGSAVTDGSGFATLLNVNIAGITPGVHAGLVGASFAGNAIYTASSGSGPLTVTNIAPVVDAPTVNGGEPSNEGQAVFAIADFFGPDLPDAYSCAVDFGDGSDPQYGVVERKETLHSFVCIGLDHTYLDDGDYTVTVEVTNREGESSSNSVVHVVNNVAPTVIDVSNDGPVDQGSSATISVTATDPAGALDPLMYEFDCDNDGTYEVGPQAGNNALCSFVDDGSFTVSVRVTDDDGGSATGSTVVVVQATAPAESTILDEISGTGPFGGSATLSATLTADGIGVAGASVDFTLNGVDVGSATTDVSGVATLSNVSLAGIGAGSYPDAVGASFAGDSTFSSTSGSSTLTVAKADQAITIESPAPASASSGSAFTVAAMSDSGLPVSYDSSGACSNSGANFTMTSGSGICTVTFSQAGDSNYNAAISVEQIVTAAKAEQSISFDLSALSKSYGDSSFDVSSYASTSSGLPISFSSATQAVCAVSDSMVSVLAAGTCTINADQAGDDTYDAASQVQQSFSVVKASLNVIANDATMTYGGAVPTFDPTVTGLVDGDTFAALGGTCSAQIDGAPVTSATPAGTYPAAINCTGVDSADYAVTYTPGTLTVDPAILTVTPDDQTVQYSDPLPTLTASYSGYVPGQDTSVLSGALSCSTAADVSGSGQVLSEAGTYSITCSGLSADNYQVSYEPSTLTVTLEGAAVRLAQHNPHAVQVDTSGSNKDRAPAMTFTARITEVSDDSYGDIALATPVTLTLDPVGGGSAISSTCTVTKVQPASSTNPGFALVSCSVPEGAPIDVYEVTMIVGGSYYQGSDTSVLTVYDPTARGSSGAGTIINSDTGHAAEISYTASYLKNGKSVQGKFLYVSRDADGNVVHILKGNVMSTMAIKGATAKITGKATLDGAGNYSYVITGIDNGTSGDQYGLQVVDSAGSLVSDLSFGPVDLGNGNIFVGN
jgi:hypothetical protein